MTEVIFLQNFTDNQIFEMLYKSKPDAMANITGSNSYPDINGTLKLYQTDTGVYAVALVYGLPKGINKCNKPVFAMHIHNGAGCLGTNEDPFADSGTHYNPDNCSHPFHAGDLPPLFSNNSFAWTAFLTDRFKVTDVAELPVIVHAKPDDFTTQPSGNSGEKIACGIIEPV